MKVEAKFRNSISTSQNCLACGADIERNRAKFCRVCGKNLREGYQPLDTLRSAHRLQGKAIVFEKERFEETGKLFEINENGTSETTWACFVYSLVPYVGVLFIPLTFVFGGFSLISSWQNPAIGGRKLALVSMILSFVVLAIQILLWWLLYIIPTLGREF